MQSCDQGRADFSRGDFLWNHTKTAESDVRHVGQKDIQCISYTAVAHARGQNLTSYMFQESPRITFTQYHSTTLHHLSNDVTSIGRAYLCLLGKAVKLLFFYSCVANILKIFFQISEI